MITQWDRYTKTWSTTIMLVCRKYLHYSILVEVFTVKIHNKSGDLIWFWNEFILKRRSSLILKTKGYKKVWDCRFGSPASLYQLHENGGSKEDGIESIWQGNSIKYVSIYLFWKRKAKAKVIRLTKMLDWSTRPFWCEFEENFVKNGTVNLQENQIKD